LAQLIEATPRGYSPEPYNNAKFTIRELSPIVWRLVRLFTNCILSLATGFSASDVNQLNQVLQLVSDPNNQAQAAYFWSRLDTDWLCLQSELINTNDEDLAIGLDILIDAMSRVDVTTAPNSARLTGIPMRNQFEQWMSTHVIGPVVGNLMAEASRIKANALQADQAVAFHFTSPPPPFFF